MADTDSKTDVPSQPGTDNLAGGHIASSMKQGAKAKSSLNVAPTPAVKNKDGSYHSEIEQTPLKRYFSSPLATTGVSTAYLYTLPGGLVVRQTTSGWGDARSSVYVGAGGASHPDTNRKHHGLDFAGATGEAVLAAAPGNITRVTVQVKVKGGPRHLIQPQEDFTPGPDGVQGTGTGDVTGFDKATGKPVRILRGELGHGGVYVEITHDGDLQGYKTHYMHLLSVPAGIREGTRVQEGAVIGYTGRSGGIGGLTEGPHLHFAVQFNDKPTPAEPTVPHHSRKNAADGAPGTDALVSTFQALQKAGKAPLGQVAIFGASAANLRGQTRAAQAASQGPAEIKKQQADYYTYQAQQEKAEATRLLRTGGQYNSKQPVIKDAMTFNYQTGLWSDGRPL